MFNENAAKPNFDGTVKSFVMFIDVRVISCALATE